MRKFITYSILISFLFFSLFYDFAKNHSWAAESDLRTQPDHSGPYVWEFNKKSFPGMEPGYLDFAGTSWTLKKLDGGREAIVHGWGPADQSGKHKYSVEFGSSVVEIEKLKLEATQTYYRTFDTDRYNFIQENIDKAKLKVFRMPEPYKEFGLAVEELGAASYQILGILWISESDESFDVDCGNDTKVKTVVDPGGGISYGGVNHMYGNDYNGDLQGDAMAGLVGLCAYDPQRLKPERYERRGNSDLFYYIFNLNQYFGKNYSANSGGPVVTLSSGKNHPSKEKIAKCGNNSSIFMDKPLTWYTDDTNKMIFDALKNTLLEGMDEDAKTTMVGYLNSPDLVSKDDDEQLYQTYYRSETNLEKYPDRKVDQVLSDNFTNLIMQSKIHQAIMSANDKDKDNVERYETTVTVAGGGVIGGKIAYEATFKGLPWLYNKLVSAGAMKTPVGSALVANGAAELSQVAVVGQKLTPGVEIIGNGMKAVQIAEGAELAVPVTVTTQTEAAVAAEATAGAGAGGAGSAIVSFLGPIVLFVVIALIAYFGWLIYQKIKFENSVKELVGDLLKLELAYSYVLANKKYQKCAEIWNDEQQSIFEKIGAAKDEAIQSAKDAINEAYKDVCPPAEFLNPPSWFRASLCGLGLALWEAGQNLMKFAAEQFEQAVGIRYGLGY